jgi:hypothetical protein
MNCTPYITNKNEMVGAFGTNGGREVRAGVWWRHLRKSDLLEDLGIYGRIENNEIDLQEIGHVWTGLMWLGIRTSGGLLWTGK